MDEVGRGNALSYPKSAQLEYAVHGKFARTEDDKKGTYGCWYVPLRKLYAAFKDSEDFDLKDVIEEFEREQAEAREEAWADIEAEPTPFDVGEGEGGAGRSQDY
jgi:hypothetical protein